MSTNKLENIPKTYYLNLDSREDRREHTENQFKTFGIKNYERISASKFLASEFDDWKHLVFNADQKIYSDNILHRVELGTAVSYIDFLENWLKTTSDPYLLLMEDDHDLSYIEDWHFDWNYLMSKLPYDWDCIQLGFENFWEIPCFLHPIHPYHSLGPSLIKRRYAEKLVEIHLVDGQYNFHQQNRNFKWSVKKDWSCSFIHPYSKRKIEMSGSGRPTPSTADYFLGHCGKTYCLPLISLMPDFGSYETDYHRNDRGDLLFTRRAYDLWWKKLKDSVSLEQFFSYGKPNDFYIDRDNIDVLSK
jgi:hypothetical protein